MNKKISIVAIALVCILSLSGCSLVITKEPEATIPPGITNPDGGIVSTNPKAVEGRVVKLTNKKLVMTVQKVEWELELTEDARKGIEILQNAGKEITKGTFVFVYYDETEDGKRQATRVERLKTN